MAAAAGSGVDSGSAGWRVLGAGLTQLSAAWPSTSGHCFGSVQLFQPGEFLAGFPTCVPRSCHPKLRGWHSSRGWYGRAGGESAALALLLKRRNICKAMAAIYTGTVSYIVEP